MSTPERQSQPASQAGQEWAGLARVRGPPPKDRSDILTVVAVIIVVVAVGIAAIAVAFVVARDFDPAPPGEFSTPPDFTLTDTIHPGAQWSLSGHLIHGRPLILEFIHPDCGACKNAVPDLKALHDRYGADVEMVTIAIYMDMLGFRNPPDVQMTLDFKNAYQTNWTYLAETQGTVVRDSYCITSVPTFFLIGKDGRTAFKQIGLSPGNSQALEDAILEALR